MADISVILPVVTSSYSVLAEAESNESIYLTTTASVDILLVNNSVSYSILAMGSEVAAAPQQQVTQVWYFS